MLAWFCPSSPLRGRQQPQDSSQTQMHGRSKTLQSALHKSTLKVLYQKPVPSQHILPICLTSALVSPCTPRGLVTPSREPLGPPEHPKVLLHRLSLVAGINHHWVSPGEPGWEAQGTPGGSTKHPAWTIYPKHFNSVPPVHLNLLLFSPIGMQNTQIVSTEASLPFPNTTFVAVSGAICCTMFSLRAGRKDPPITFTECQELLVS